MAYILGTLEVDHSNRSPEPNLHQAMPSNGDHLTGNAVRRNLSTPSGSTGQDAAPPASPTRFTVESLVGVLDMLRQLDEQAKADVQAPTHPARTDADPTLDRARGARNHCSFGDARSDREALSKETGSET